MSAETTRPTCKRCPCPASPSDGSRCSHCRKHSPCPVQQGTARGAAKGAKGTTATGDAPPSDVPPFNPFPGGAPADLPVWAVPYLVAVAAKGTEYKCASEAGIRYRDVAALVARHPDFAEALQEAREYHADLLEGDLPNSKTPIGRIAKLKTIRPSKYETSLITANVHMTTNNVAISDHDAARMLASMLSQVTPATRALLAGEPLPFAAETPAIVDPEPAA